MFLNHYCACLIIPSTIPDCHRHAFMFRHYMYVRFFIWRHVFKRCLKYTEQTFVCDCMCQYIRNFITRWYWQQAYCILKIKLPIYGKEEIVRITIHVRKMFNVYWNFLKKGETTTHGILSFFYFNQSCFLSIGITLNAVKWQILSSHANSLVCNSNVRICFMSLVFNPRWQTREIDLLGKL